MAKKKPPHSAANSPPSKAVASSPATTPSATPGIRTLRAEIAKLDKQIAAAVAERAEQVRQLAAQQPTAESRLSDLAVTAVNQGSGAVSDAAMRAVFREVVAASHAAVAPFRVAYLGPEDSYSHLTAIARFGEASELTPVSTIAAVFEEVACGSCALGVVPLENSTHGRVTDTLEAFSKTEVQICGEAPMRIRHCLLGQGPRSAIRRVISKPQALSQCNHWLAEHLPGVETTPASSTSEAAALAAADPRIAAIASEQAGRRHGLEVLAKGIEDQHDNITRFAVIGPQSGEKTGDDKTALMFEIAHEPGSLADAMAIFKRRGLNMTWIESFPIPGSRGAGADGGRYLFFIELMGHQAEVRVRRAIDSLQKKCVLLRVLGSYARAAVLG
ncbi:prephenate dehydratase [Botrimarina hoheduenensis]|uniref:Bifunctional chorismate mutase/prephenate dehydratase n=1 Tax=Botrimarina hoheduenensis TaxID=2528000 RepID=A0A5C5WCG4_9BACT|nr:prephenate dehydratase [Botrimarina hoheduenensis]TWT47755.1 P-protein [Botrimarina hoheduenensis]